MVLSYVERSEVGNDLRFRLEGRSPGALRRPGEQGDGIPRRAPARNRGYGSRDWTVEQNSGRYAVVHRTGLANGVRPDNLPKTLDGTMPVLVGTGNGRVFLID